MVISTTLDGGFEYNVLDGICELCKVKESEHIWKKSKLNLMMLLMLISLYT